MTGEERVPTVLRNLRIIEIIARKGRPMTATEINRDLELPKQSIHRLCSTLVREGFLSLEPDGRSLRPGRRLRSVGAGVLHASRSHIMRHQILVDLAGKVGEAVNFVVPRDTGMLYVDRVETYWRVRIQLPVGTIVPFHCTASGKVFLASHPESERRSFVGALQLKKHTPNTIDDHDSLLEDTTRVAAHGYALDSEEFIEEMNAIAVPVTDDLGRYVASLAVHGPAQRLSTETAISRVDLLQDAAKELRRALFS